MAQQLTTPNATQGQWKHQSSIETDWAGPPVHKKANRRLIEEASLPMHQQVPTIREPTPSNEDLPERGQSLEWTGPPADDDMSLGGLCNDGQTLPTIEEAISSGGNAMDFSEGESSPVRESSRRGATAYVDEDTDSEYEDMSSGSGEESSIGEFDTSDELLSPSSLGGTGDPHANNGSESSPWLITASDESASEPGDDLEHDMQGLGF